MGDKSFADVVAILVSRHVWESIRANATPAPTETIAALRMCGWLVAVSPFLEDNRAVLLDADDHPIGIMDLGTGRVGFFDLPSMDLPKFTFNKEADHARAE